MGGPSGGAGDVMYRNPAGEKKTVGNWYDFNIGRRQDYVTNDPLLGPAQSGALDFWKQLPGMLAQFPGFQKEITGAQGDIKGYQGQLGDVYSQMGGLFGQIPGLQKQIGGYQRQLQMMAPGINRDYDRYQNQLGSQYNTLGGWLGAPGGPSGIIASGGALTPELLRNSQQQSLALQERAGTAHTSGGLANTVLNSEAAREARLARAQQQGQSFLGQQTGITGQQGALTGQKAGILSGLIGQGMQGTGMLGNLLSLGQNLSQGMAGVTGQGAAMAQAIAGLTGQKANLLGQQQGLQTGGINQLLGIGNAASSQFAQATNPMLSYLSNLFSGNQQASIAKAQIDTQAAAQGDKKLMDSISAGGDVLGSVIGGVAMSDERLKTKIKGTGLKIGGIPIKTYEFKTRPGVPFIGPMAQDVEKVNPEAVITDPVSGVKMINFWKLQVPMAQLKGVA